MKKLAILALVSLSSTAFAHSDAGTAAFETYIGASPSLTSYERAAGSLVQSLIFKGQEVIEKSGCATPMQASINLTVDVDGAELGYSSLASNFTFTSERIVAGIFGVSVKNSDAGVRGTFKFNSDGSSMTGDYASLAYRNTEFLQQNRLDYGVVKGFTMSTYASSLPIKNYFSESFVSRGALASSDYRVSNGTCKIRVELDGKNDATGISQVGTFKVYPSSITW
jgi:hypothetical protein